MGRSWNYFKSYEIHSECEYSEIRYLDGGTLDFSYSTIASLSNLLGQVGMRVPVYDEYGAGNVEQLELIEPQIFSKTCEKAMKLIEKEEDKESLMDVLRRIYELSQEGNYFTIDKE